MELNREPMRAETLAKLIEYLTACMEIGWEGSDTADDVEVCTISNMIEAPGLDGINAGIRIGLVDETGKCRTVELVAREIL